MNGKLKYDLAYCEIFAEHEKDPGDIALRAGYTFEVLAEHDSTYLALIPDGNGLAYVDIPKNSVKIVKEKEMKQTKKQIHEQEIERVKTRLREIIHPGDTIYTSLKHVSRSGMYRVINLYVMVDNHPQNIDWLASQLLEGYDDRHQGCKAGGCGMDMGFALVYHLSGSLFRGNFTCTGEKCTSNDHANGDRDYSPHQHSDGGYALKHQWM